MVFLVSNYEAGQGTKAAGSARDSFWRRKSRKSQGHHGGSHLTLGQHLLIVFQGLVMLPESSKLPQGPYRPLSLPVP